MSSFLDPHSLVHFGRDIIRASLWLLLLAVIFLPLEWLFSVHPRRILSRTTASDIGFYFLSGLLPALILGPLLALAAAALYNLVPYTVHATVAGWPIWARALSGLVVSEVGFYWGHRWAHAVPLLWRFHAVHHDPKELHFLISSRAHPLDNVFIRLCGFAPIYALGIATPLTPAGGAVSAIVAIILMCWGFFVHANLHWRFGPLEWLVATPAFHHWHHTLGEPRDRNFAAVLPVMDWIFGTAHLPRQQWPAQYGTDTLLPRSLVPQLLFPFIGDRRRTAQLEPEPVAPPIYSSRPS